MPKISFDAGSVAAFPFPTSGRTRVWDTTRPGFGMLLTSNRHRSFFFRYISPVTGDERYFTIPGDLSLKQAERQYTLARADVLARRDPTGDKIAARRESTAVKVAAKTAAEHSLESVFEKYKAANAQLRSLSEKDYLFRRHIYRYFGSDRDATTITRSDVNKMLDDVQDVARAKGGPGTRDGATTAQNVLVALGSVLAWWAARGGAPDSYRSPIVKGMGRIKVKERARTRTLSEDELRAVWTVASENRDPFDFLSRFILLTATRKLEAAEMNRSELLPGGVDWVIPGTRMKGNLPHLVPMSTAALELLASMHVIGNKGWVFTYDGSAPMKGFGKTKRRFDKRVLAELRSVATERGDTKLLTYVAEVERLFTVLEDDKATDAAKVAARLRLKVIPHPSGDPKQAGWYTTHDLRRTSRSLLGRLNATVSRDIAEKCLAHVAKGVEATYDHYDYRDEKAAAFEALASLLQRIVNPSSDNVVPLRRSA